jgi:GNAT superfamily N-acetyltransferase
MFVSLRPLNLETDAARYAELLSVLSPKPITIQQVHEQEEHFPRDGIRQRLVALDANGGIIGCNNAAHVPYMLLNSFWIQLVVAPDFRRHGVGARLYENALEFARAQGTTRLECEVRDREPDLLRFVQARGFQIDRHIFESVLDLATFDVARFAGVIESVQAQGIRFFTLADVGNTEENQRKLYEVNKRNSLDIPGSEGTFPRFEDFSKFVFQASWFRPQGQILAADGDRCIGLGAVGYFVNTNSTYNMHTGVLKEYRGRKIALALKLLAIRYSRGCGAVLLRTDNDSQNAPILAINEKLGYQPQLGFFRCLKVLDRVRLR